ncbi:hypothetical protein JT359_18600 [Candidatus Poribacteria bacterium]|nr:hypothetical protein [Candidatus Poribacteria bacterium]
MKINRNLNWNKFFIRLTIVISIIAYIATWITLCIKNPYGFMLLEKQVVIYAFIGTLAPIAVWSLYFAIRWIYRGLQKDANDS